MESIQVMDKIMERFNIHKEKNHQEKLKDEIYIYFYFFDDQIRNIFVFKEDHKGRNISKFYLLLIFLGDFFLIKCTLLLYLSYLIFKLN